jgi:uncharacterized protein (TIGR02145 family)
MKNTIILLFVLCANLLLAQAPNRISYQAVARDSKGKVLVNGQVSFEISLHQGSANGTVLYVERHTVTTNQDGLATMEIGSGTVVSGNFQTINWNNTPIFLRSKLDLFGKNIFLLEGVTQLVSAPYSLFANVVEYDSLYNKPDLSTFATPADLQVQQDLISTYSNGPVQDIHGNFYEVVQIGNQVWFTENLRVTQYNDGTPIFNELTDSAWTFLRPGVGAYAWLNNDSMQNAHLGALYNFSAVTSNKLCPLGYHVPTRAEFDTLKVHLGGNLFVSNDPVVAQRARTIVNTSGFSAANAGLRVPSIFDPSGFFQPSTNLKSFFATQTELGVGVSRIKVVIDDNSFFITTTISGMPDPGINVRCIKE